ncbi:MAG: pyridoxal 5'-phosphate synthase glutaminase subunit PdxT, partial [Fimbriimonadales bacterium]
MTGILALQGDFAAHARALEACGETWVEVRTPSDLDRCERLIIPGGESTTLGILLKLAGLDTAIPDRIKEVMPVWGTCMGMILLAKEIEGSDQLHFSMLDITVRRNAFGAQVFSFEQGFEMRGLDEPVHGVFIRAPIVTRFGESVEPLAEIDDQIVAVRSDKILGTSFHPELTGDTRIHEYFLSF